MDIYTIQEEAYKRGYEKGYADALAFAQNELRPIAEDAKECLQMCKQLATEVGDKWIPVKERLPKSAIDGFVVSENVIVHTIDGEVTSGWLEGSGHDCWCLVIGENDHHTEHERGYVTHWMPLPEPPKGE